MDAWTTLLNIAALMLFGGVGLVAIVAVLDAAIEHKTETEDTPD